MEPDSTAICDTSSGVIYGVPESPARLVAIEARSIQSCKNEVLAALAEDNVAYIRGADASFADDILAQVTSSLNLYDQLVLQAAFASNLGHRTNVGQYYMTVNQRADYKFIPSHSEGQRRVNMQLAAFYCYENSTDGGVTILQNVDSESAAWAAMREVVTKIDLCGKRLSAPEAARIKMQYALDPLRDTVQSDDVILSERPTDISGVKFFTVLSKVEKSHSSILQKDLNVYWDNVASTDRQSSAECARMLESAGLLRRPNDETPGTEMDQTLPRKVWTSGVSYEQLFKAKLTLKMEPGDVIIQNNFTWTHSASNWTPESGRRQIAAAFA